MTTPRAASLGAAASGIHGLGLLPLFGLPALVEAGVPVPVPADLLYILVGQRAGAGAISLPLALLATEAVVVLGLLSLYVVARRVGEPLLQRVGSRIGLTEARLLRVRGLVQRRGRGALTVGRATPGLRTLTVVVGAGSGARAAHVVPPLLLGGTLFVQGHVLLGYLLGPAADAAFERARTPLLAGLAVLVVAGAVFWLMRRRGRAAVSEEGWAEAACPLCLLVATAAERVLEGREPAAAGAGVAATMP